MLAQSYHIRCLAPLKVQSLEEIDGSEEDGSIWTAQRTQYQSEQKVHFERHRIN